MTRVNFEWNDPLALASELAQPIVGVRYLAEAPTTIDALTLVRPDGSGLLIRSEMAVLSSRVEVGVLSFQRVRCLEGVYGTIAPSFHDIKYVEKLVIDEQGIRVESGILLKNEKDNELIVVAAAMPCTLAVLGLISPAIDFSPEYSLYSYRRVTL